MSWAGAVMIWAGACSNFPTLKIPQNAKKKKKKESVTDGRTDTMTYRPRCPRQKEARNVIDKENSRENYRKGKCFSLNT